MADAGWTQQARDAALLDQLERRRNAHDRAMWQAPALTIAGQAFLPNCRTLPPPNPRGPEPG